FRHTPFYCEENVYFLCKKLCEDGVARADGSDLYVAFISNELKQAIDTLLILIVGFHHDQIPLWNQKASNRADGVILWDYHVICIQVRRNNLPRLVWDLDSTLPFPSPLPSYLDHTLRPSFKLFSDFVRVFRIVCGPMFLRHFASDRRHMKDSEGNWIHPPPSYEPIGTSSVHNLNEYIEMSSKDVGTTILDDVDARKLGVLVGESQLEEFFS
ncbi:hypothetical protein M569_04510, partial [Genlisea aurea]